MLKGLELSELLYKEAVQPILASHFPTLVTSAALLGPGSDVLGFDTTQSRDHDWGPRLLLFLAEGDYPIYRKKVDAVLKEELPHELQGYPIDMARRDGEPTGDPQQHAVRILTVRQFFKEVIRVDIRQEITPLDWVLIPQQQLRSVTAGKVFCDDLGELEAARARLAYYPKDEWLYLLAAQWMRIGQEEPFMGRCGQAGDELGSRLVAHRLIKDLMNLSFLMERQYAPYIKWFGTAFSQLACAKVLIPLFEQVSRAATWQERQLPLAQAFEFMAHWHNQLGITEVMSEKASYFYERPFLVIGGERFYKEIYKQIRDPNVLALLPKLGGVDQFLDSTDAFNNLNENFDRIKSLINSLHLP